MARGERTIQILNDDLDDTPVEDPNELFACFIGINGTVYQLDLVRKNMTALQAAVKKYITAAEKADDGNGSNVKKEAFDIDKGFTGLRFRSSQASSATGSSSVNTSKMTGTDLAGKVADWTWTDEVNGKHWLAQVNGHPKTKNKVVPGGPVQPETAGFKAFVLAMSEDAGSTRIPIESYYNALLKAKKDGLIEGTDGSTD